MTTGFASPLTADVTYKIVGESFQNYVMLTDRNAESSRTGDVDWVRVALKADVTSAQAGPGQHAELDLRHIQPCLGVWWFTTWPAFIRVESKAYTAPDGTLLPNTTLDWPRKTKGWCLRVFFSRRRPHHQIHPVVRRRPTTSPSPPKGPSFPIGSALIPSRVCQGTLTIASCLGHQLQCQIGRILGTNKAARWRASKANIGLLHQRPAESSRGAIMLTQTKIQEQSRDDLGIEVGIEYDD